MISLEFANPWNGLAMRPAAPRPPARTAPQAGPATTKRATRQRAIWQLLASEQRALSAADIAITLALTPDAVQDAIAPMAWCGQVERRTGPARAANGLTVTVPQYFVDAGCAVPAGVQAADVGWLAVLREPG